jgi:hypothetical protein
MPVALSGMIASVLGTSALGVALQSGLAWMAIGGATALGGALLNIGLSVGLSALASTLFRPQQPKPEDVQQSFKQPTAPRIRHYGRVKMSGPWVFAEAKNGIFHKVIALGVGPFDAIEEVWVDDKNVTGKIDANGRVQLWPWTGSGHDSLLRIQYRLGEARETAYGPLVSTFSEWTAEHRGDGVASLFASQFASSQEYYLKRFPNGINTNYRVVARTSKVKNPVTGVTAWSDNAAAVIRDYMTHKDGMRLPESLFTTPLAQAGWIAAFNRANENIPIKAGGTEPRYRLWGSYRLDERPADVVGRMINCCDGRIVPTPDGGLTLDIGNWQEPSVIIDANAIVGFSDLGRGRDIMTTANTIRATFLDPSQDYQAADADPWVDEADVLERGEIAKDVQFNMAPSHSQARRLMKLEWFRANPSWVGTFTCNLRGLAAFGERFVRIRYPLFGINSVFEVQDFRFVLGEGGIVRGVTLQVQSMPETAYQWDPEQEGTAPVSNHTKVDDELPIPSPPKVAFKPGPVANLTFPPSPSPILSYQVRTKKRSDAEWQVSGPLENKATSFATAQLAHDTEYEFQLAFATERGRLGGWSARTVQKTPAEAPPEEG